MTFSKPRAPSTAFEKGIDSLSRVRERVGTRRYDSIGDSSQTPGDYIICTQMGLLSQCQGPQKDHICHLQTLFYRPFYIPWSLPEVSKNAPV